MEKCILCLEKDIELKKRKLCRRCYQRLYRRHDIEGIGPKQEHAPKLRPFESEAEFIKNHFKHENWIYQPATFQVNGYGRYTPDFVDLYKGTFIEVVGSYHAARKNRDKIKAFIKQYENVIRFEIMDRFGNPLDIDKIGNVKNDRETRKLIKGRD